MPVRSRASVHASTQRTAARRARRRMGHAARSGRATQQARSVRLRDAPGIVCGRDVGRERPARGSLATTALRLVHPVHRTAAPKARGVTVDVAHLLLAERAVHRARVPTAGRSGGAHASADVPVASAPRARLLRSDPRGARHGRKYPLDPASSCRSRRGALDRVEEGAGRRIAMRDRRREAGRREKVPPTPAASMILLGG